MVIFNGARARRLGVCPYCLLRGSESERPFLQSFRGWPRLPEALADIHIDIGTHHWSLQCPNRRVPHPNYTSAGALSTLINRTLHIDSARPRDAGTSHGSTGERSNPLREKQRLLASKVHIGTRNGNFRFPSPSACCSRQQSQSASISHRLASVSGSRCCEIDLPCPLCVRP